MVDLHTNPTDCPAAQRQLENLCAAILLRLTDNLSGIYLHGSLAMGCFNPLRSDLELLVITKTTFGPLICKEIGELLLAASNQPFPIEIHFLVNSDMHPWRYPPHYVLHYSEAWRARFTHDLTNNDWHHWEQLENRDPDLGVHITVARARGIALYGPPTQTIFPVVPRTDYLAALRYDFQDAFQKIDADPVYPILNICRTIGYLQSGAIFSKAEGGEWALANLPETYHPLIRAALANCLLGNPLPDFEGQQLVDFAMYGESRIQTELRTEIHNGTQSVL